ncbi:MAG TPA: Sec-independent protein translocase subunit TatA [Pseudonocardia sp.]|nr:Sec-independent protein translocase subunit TatA [Pseudonocardia sp.]
MGELSPWHWAIVIIVLVVLFGARRLPDAARSLGRSARILKSELRADDAPPPDAPPATPRSAEPTISSPQSDPRHD